MSKAKETAKKNGAKLPADHKAPEKPFKEYPGAEYFRPLNEIDPADALDLIENLENFDTDQETSIAELKPVFKKIATETFITDVEAFRKNFYHAGNLAQAVKTMVAYLNELGKELS